MKKLLASRLSLLPIAAMVFPLPVLNAAHTPDQARAEAKAILDAASVQGGLIIHLGCGDGTLTAGFRQGEQFTVHGLDTSARNVQAARDHIQTLGLYGHVSVDLLRDDKLPYIDNLANLIVADDQGTVPTSEIMRSLKPDGVAYLRSGEKWNTIIKPRPGEIDEWTHYLHDPSNNAVAQDTVVGPPNRLQWVGSPRSTRHHDRMSGINAVVSASGRLFYIFDEASPVSILIPPKWSLIARDAFNGVILWKRSITKWHTHLFPLKSGPAQLPRRLVASGDRVYVTLSYDAPLTSLDAATGATALTYNETKGTEEIILSEKILFLVVNPNSREAEYANLQDVRRGYGKKSWDGETRRIMAVRATDGKVLWTALHPALPLTLAVNESSVFFHNGQSVVALDRQSGRERWLSEPVRRADVIQTFYAPTLVLHNDVVLFSGGEAAGKQAGWSTAEDTMSALSATTGKVLWTAAHPASGYRSPEDILVVDGLVWTGETTSGRSKGVFTGRDPLTGEVKSEFPPDVDIYWFHHRCYRAKATSQYLLMARTGTEFIDVRKQSWTPHHWFRGACLYGVMPANGLIYAPQNPCACYMESKLNGFNALAPASPTPRLPLESNNEERLEKGPAYLGNYRESTAPDEWPTYRHDAARSGHASTTVSHTLRKAWQTEIGGRLSSPVLSGGRLFVSAVDSHAVHALDAASGKPLWKFTAGGRVDSPPTIYHGRVLFGSTDGSVYCLRASDGALAWRFQAAPMDQRLIAFEHLESVWPVPGNVLVQDNTLYCVAGRSMFLDTGLRLWRLDPETGRVLSKTILNDDEPETGKELQDYVSWLNMPPALPDILSSDGHLVYMRSQPFRLDGSRLPLRKMPRRPDADQGAPDPVQRRDRSHLFCPTGFRDDSWFHRTYWMYGDTFISGWSGYYRAGKVSPAGRILVFDNSTVYGFGRKPQYYKWTTPIEHQLFSANKYTPTTQGSAADNPDGSRIRVANSESLSPAGKPLTVEAWVKADRPGGVILARGGNALGYALYLQKGRPHFVVRANQKTAVASAPAAVTVTGRWTHLAGTLTEKTLQIYVDGEPAGSVTSPGLIPNDPSEGLEIGADERTPVGDYPNPLAFTGSIDEVRIYNQALNQTQIGRHAAENGHPEAESLVLNYSFDTGEAVDLSGRNNNGLVEGAVAVKGRVGTAMKFTGKTAPPDFKVRQDWTEDVPIYARALLKAGPRLFAAGPEDILDEPQIFSRIDDPTIRPDLDAQASAIDGKEGAKLVIVSSADGHPLAQYDLDYPPVFDGMAAASERLYLSTTAGSVLCFSED